MGKKSGREWRRKRVAVTIPHIFAAFYLRGRTEAMEKKLRMEKKSREKGEERGKKSRTEREWQMEEILREGNKAEAPVRSPLAAEGLNTSWKQDREAEQIFASNLTSKRS
ncbi:unnamed protein product [Microthlaspi erraticum]|uniref:Uncharacterized protein n=1 Tax=Microthlaspi erraticum TaxID=1685480 RepID=A0A6D2JWT3_9BRAS|nr:unnamed protein product [Microthlaspi erraticum]